MAENGAKSASGNAVKGSAGTVILTLCAVAALGFAVMRVVPSSAIFAAEPHASDDHRAVLSARGAVPEIVAEPAQAQQEITEGADWAPAFGTRPPPAPAPVIREPEPAATVTRTVAPPEPEPAPQRHLDYWLTGHIIDGARSLAFVHDGRDEQVVRAGSVLSGGEEVVAISADGVRARFAGEEFMIVVRDDLPQARQQSAQFQGAGAQGAATPARQAENNNRRSFLHQGSSAPASSAMAGRNADLDDEDWGDDEYDDDWDDWDDWDDDDWDD